MRGIVKASIAAAVIGIGSLLISYIGGPSRAAVDNTRDCDTVAIFYCGAMSESEFHNKWNNDTKYKDHATVFSAFGLKKDDVRGMVDGIVWKDGRVTLGNATNGKVVATGAITAGRWNNPKSGMTKIANTDRAYKMSTSNFVTEGQTAMIKLDANGKFQFAVIKSCGNPVTGKPVEPPKPDPQARCVELKQPVIADRKVTLTSSASATNGATISDHIFTIYDASGKQVDRKTTGATGASTTVTFDIKTPGTYTAKLVIVTTLGEKTGAECEKKFTIKEAPAARCVELKEPVITNRTRVALTSSASATNGATISDHIFTIYDANGRQIARQTTGATSATTTANFDVTTPGTYTAKLVIVTSLGEKTGAECEKKFTIKAADEPGVSIEKTVNGKENEEVTVNTPFTYEIVVRNTGNVDLKGVKVEDKAPDGVQFQKASAGTISNNVWTHTLDLKKGAHAEFKITAIATKQLDGGRKNTACVDAPSVPGNPDDCDDAHITTKEPKKPGVSIDKKVNGADHAAVETGVEFTYQLRVTNTGNTDLQNVLVTDKQPTGVTFVRASHGQIADGAWSYTISELKKGSSMDFTITAVVPEYKAGTIPNTACVDAPSVPGKPDDCDDASVEVPKPEEEIVCRLKDKKYPHIIKRGDFDKELYSRDPADCDDEVVPPTPEEPTPEKPTPEKPTPELPQTGATDVFFSALGFGALTTSVLAYIASRRNSLIG